MTEVASLPEATRQLLTTLDDRLVEVLHKGDIALVRSAWLLALPDDARLARRQDLQAIGEITPLLTPDEAVNAIRKGNRSVGALSHGWMSPVCATPDVPSSLPTTPHSSLSWRGFTTPPHRATGCACRATPIPTAIVCAHCGAR